MKEIYFETKMFGDPGLRAPRVEARALYPDSDPSNTPALIHIRLLRYYDDDDPSDQWIVRPLHIGKARVIRETISRLDDTVDRIQAWGVDNINTFVLK